ncbi:MAG: hypothetical protein H0V97_01085 [Actinobacteria bacterium]|nr:hypothetical protein [Actinomycetota bacterium]
MTTPLARRARVGDAAAFARIWLDMCRYYADLAPDNLRIPSGEGLPPGSEDEIKLRSTASAPIVGALRAWHGLFAGRVELPQGPLVASGRHRRRPRRTFRTISTC